MKEARAEVGEVVMCLSMRSRIPPFKGGKCCLYGGPNVDGLSSGRASSRDSGGSGADSYPSHFLQCSNRGRVSSYLGSTGNQ